MAAHRHQTPLRGVKAVPRPREGRSDYSPTNYEYAGREGRIHETMEIRGSVLAKIGFPDRKIVYYYLEDLELDENAGRSTFHDAAPPKPQGTR